MKFYDQEMQWMTDSNCATADPELFFDSELAAKGTNRTARYLAKQVCNECVVRSECLEYALAHDQEFGVWGGLDQDERRALKRRNVA